jgi:hypothetical protein
LDFYDEIFSIDLLLAERQLPQLIVASVYILLSSIFLVTQSSRFRRPGPQMATTIIFQWLERIGLGHAIPMFQSQGIISPQALMELTSDRFNSLGVSDGESRPRRPDPQWR